MAQPKHPTVRIIVVDDHVMVRIGLVTLLSDEPGFKVVGQSRLGAEAVRMFSELKPDVVLLDGNLPDMHGTEVMRRMLARDPEAAVIIISINETAEDVHAAMTAGAKAYVPKSHDQEVILRAVHVVASGGVFLTEELAARLEERGHGAILSHREVEVLELIARGNANKEIAAVLQLSENTVKTHVTRILGKLAAADRTRAVTIAIQRGLIRI